MVINYLTKVGKNYCKTKIQFIIDNAYKVRW